MTANCQHNWITINSYAYFSEDDNNRLITIEQYCSICERISIYYQSASDCRWCRVLEPARVIMESNGEVLGSRWDFS